MAHFNISRFGLNEREIRLLLEALNGVGLPDALVPTAQWLTQNLYSAGVEANTDLAETGVFLGQGEANPEIPYEYVDLCEKVANLKDWEAAALYYYSIGFFDGQTWILDFGQSGARI